ncbi:MAG: ATP-binding cassette domain-containing protein [Candidatus Cryptobacteroides sp.]
MIQVQNLAFSYDHNEVLKNINLKLEEGRIYGLLGENGVGKTTLLTLLSGLKKPQIGSIEADGIAPFSRDPEYFSDMYYLPDDLAKENDRAGSWARSRGVFWNNYSHDKFLSIMAEFEVNPEQKLNAMSTGQLKKTHIAFALACSTKYLFMDEPTNGLDIPSKTSFRSAIFKYTSDSSVVVISTHQVRDLENIIDPIIILDKQQVLLNASIEDISRKLYFDYGQTLHPESLYSEQLPGGFIQVYQNTDGLDSKVNIEALFNAVYKNKELTKTLFSNE